MKFRVIEQQYNELDGENQGKVVKAHWLEPIDDDAKKVQKRGSFKLKNGRLAVLNPDDLPLGATVEVLF